MKISQIFKTDKDIAKIATVLKFELSVPRGISQKNLQKTEHFFLVVRVLTLIYTAQKF